MLQWEEDYWTADVSDVVSKESGDYKSMQDILWLNPLMADIAYRPPSVFFEQAVYDHVQLVHSDVIMRMLSKFQYNQLIF